MKQYYLAASVVIAAVVGSMAPASAQVRNPWNGFYAGLHGGYAWQDAEITSTTSAAPAGREVPLVPEHTFSLWNKYDFNDRFGAGLGVVHQTKMFASISNTVTLPGFTRVDAAVFVRLTDALRAQVDESELVQTDAVGEA